MNFGVHGNYLLVDVSRGVPEQVHLPHETLFRSIGGVGLAVEILTANSQFGYDPLAPEAPLAFVTSPLVGTPLTTSAKFVVAAKSPLTGRICDAMCSSHFALALKNVGTDALCLTGRADRLAILMIDGTVPGLPKIDLIDAAGWTGLSASATEEAVRHRFGMDWRVVSTGKAGEMLVPFATLSHDGRHAGRGGLGAVLGAKNLKAIAVRGSQRMPLFDPARTVTLAKRISELSFTPATAKYRELGTVSNLLVFNRFGALPTRNFQAGTFDRASDLTTHDLGPARKIARESCAVCTIGCEHIYALKPRDSGTSVATDNSSDDRKPGGVRMEYESLFALGPLCGISDPETVLRAAAMCDEFGLDTITLGGTAAFLMECAEQGLIEASVGHEGKSLRFGDGGALLALIEESVSDSPGATARLARMGSRAAALEIGQGAIAFAPQVKGLELPGYHPGTLHAMALGMAVGSRGADHNRTGAYEVDFAGRPDGIVAIAEAVVDKENRSILMDSLILCKFLRGVFQDLYAESAEMLNAVTGLNYDAATLERIAAEIVDARRRFNIREGGTPAEDTLPPKLLEPDGSNTNPNATSPPLTRERLDSLIAAYYRARSWSAEGYPSSPPPETIE